jgi:hypothetical protein
VHYILLYFQVCASEHDLFMHKKRHKIDEALICPYCQRSYVDQHRYAVHVRFHTGETPFHCDLCGKGFRDDRKMKLHMARHNSGLSHKCHLCPRSFEGPKALEKHLNAHATGRYVAPKVIHKSDGSTAMALPDDKVKEAAAAMASPAAGIIEPAAWMSGGGGVKSSEMSFVGELSRGEPDVMSRAGSPLAASGQKLTDLKVEGELLLAQDMTMGVAVKDEGAEEEGEGEAPSAGASVISLSVDDLYQYSVAQSGLDLPR